MKAAVCVAGAIELREWPEPVPGPGELLLRVSGCGLCGSDILKINAAVPGPAVLGHEVVGQVLEVGPGVRRFASGDRLVWRITCRAFTAITAAAAARPCAAASSA
jgi:threonine dehydrogenase-like Zn-dependent dehydrogenase